MILPSPLRSRTFQLSGSAIIVAWQLFILALSRCNLYTTSVQSGYSPFIFPRLSAEFVRRASHKLRRKETARLEKIPGFHLSTTRIALGYYHYIISDCRLSPISLAQPPYAFAGKPVGSSGSAQEYARCRQLVE